MPAQLVRERRAAKVTGRGGDSLALMLRSILRSDTAYAKDAQYPLTRFSMRILFTPHYIGAPVITSAYPSRSTLPMSHFDTLDDLTLDDRFVTPNSGNMIHAEALPKVIDCDRNKSAAGYIPRFTADGDNGRSNALLSEHFDLVTLSYANILHDFSKLSDAQKDKLETGFAHQRAFLENSKIRVAAFGIGLQDDIPAQPSSIGPELYRLLHVLNDRCDIIGTRGERTANFLSDIGITRAQPLGCPSVIVNPRGVLDPAIPSIDTNLKVGTSGRLSASGRNSGRMESICNLAREFNTEFVFQNDIYNLFKGAQRSDIAYNSESCEVDYDACDAAATRLFKRSPGFRRYWYFRSPDAWRSWAATRDIYLGDRFHGGVAFLQAGRPAGFLHHDTRVSELTDHYGLPSFSFEDAKQRSIQDLLQEIVDPVTQDRVRKTFCTRFRAYAEALEAVGLRLRPTLPEVRV